MEQGNKRIYGNSFVLRYVGRPLGLEDAQVNNGYQADGGMDGGTPPEKSDGEQSGFGNGEAPPDLPNGMSKNGEAPPDKPQDGNN